MLQLKHPRSRLLPYLPESPVLHYYCSDRGDSSALLGQILLCSGIVFALESEVPGSNLGARSDSALGTSLS